MVCCATPFSPCAFHAVPKQRWSTQHAAWLGITPNNRHGIADLGEPHHTIHSVRAHDVPRDTPRHLASRSGHTTAVSAQCDSMHYFGMRLCCLHVVGCMGCAIRRSYVLSVAMDAIDPNSLLQPNIPTLPRR